METGRAYPSLRRGNRPGLPVPVGRLGHRPSELGQRRRRRRRGPSTHGRSAVAWPRPRRKVASGVARRSTPCATSRATPSSSITWSLAKRIHPEGRRKGGKPRIHLESIVRPSFVSVLVGLPAVSTIDAMPKRKSRTASEAVTVAFPEELPVRRETTEVWWVTLPERELRLSNLTKIFWPEEGYTKGDLLAYYFNVAAPAAPPPRATPADDEADAQRDGRRLLLREDRAVAHARTGCIAARCCPRTRRKAGSTTSRSTTSRRCCSSRTSGRSRCTRCTRAAATRSTPTTCSSTSTRSRPTPTRTCSPSRGT